MHPKVGRAALMILIACAMRPIHAAGLSSGIFPSQACTPGVDNPTIDNGGSTLTITSPLTSQGNLCMTGSGKTLAQGPVTVAGNLWIQEGRVEMTGLNNEVHGGTAPSTSIIDPASLWLQGANVTLRTPDLTNHGILGGTGTITGDVTNLGTIVSSDAARPVTTTRVESKLQQITSNHYPAWLNDGRVPLAQGLSIEGNLVSTDPSRNILSFSLSPTSSAPLIIRGKTAEVGSNLIIDYHAVSGVKGLLRPTYTLIQDPTPGASLSLTDTPHLEIANTPPKSHFLLSYDPTGALYLTITPTRPFQAMGGNKNQREMERYLDAEVPKASGALYSALNRLYQLPKQEFLTALNQLDGELHTETPGILFNAVADSWTPVYARMGINASLGGYDPANGGHFWMSGLGGVGGVQGNYNASGYSNHSAGTLLGADTLLADGVSVGLTAGYLSAGANRTGYENSLNANYWQIGTYGDIEVGQTGHLGLLFGYDQGGLNTQNLSLLGLARTSQESRIITAEVLGSWRYDFGGGHSLSPILALQSITVQHPAFMESGLDALGSGLGSYNGDFVSARIQARYDYQWHAFNIDWTSSLAAGLREMINQPGATSTVILKGAQGHAFIAQGAQPNSETGQALVNAGIAGHLTDEFDMEVGYRGLYTGSSQFSSFLGNLTWRYDAPRKEVIHGITTQVAEIENPVAAEGDNKPLTIRDPGADMANYPNSAFTLPKGGFYLESTPMSYSARSPMTGSPTFSSPTLFRYGFLEDVELRLFYTPYQVQQRRTSTVSGSGNLAFDTKIHLWDEWEEYFVPAAGFELTIQTPWISSTAFQSPTSPAFSFNFDQGLPYDIAIEYNLGANYQQDPKNLDKEIWAFSAQWAAQRDITEDVALFFNGFYNNTTLPRVARKTTEYREEVHYKYVCKENGGTQRCQRQKDVVRVPFTVRVPLENVNSVPVLLGGGLIWTLDDHLQLFGNAAAGVTQSSPSMQAYVGFAWTP